MTGFALMVLIVISSYTANLAAFLSASKPHGTISSINDVSVVCGHPALKKDYKTLYPEVEFYFTDKKVSGNMGMIESFREGKCDAIAASDVEIYNCVECMEVLCQEPKIVVTDIFIVEFPIAFPVNKDLAAGISHWMLKGINMHISFFQHEESARPEKVCHLDHSVQDSELEPLTPEHMIFPFVVLICSLLLSIIIHLCNGLKVSTNQSSEDEVSLHRHITKHETKHETKDDITCCSSTVIRHGSTQQNVTNKQVKDSGDTAVKKSVIRNGDARLELIEAIKRSHSYQNNLLQMLELENQVSVENEG